MSTTYQQLIDQGLGHNAANTPKLFTYQEANGVLNRRLSQIYTRTARLNPFYLATFADILGDGFEWKRPSTIELMWRVERPADASEVHVVPIDDKLGEIPPRIYQLGAGWRSVLQSGDPGTRDILRFFFSQRYPQADMNVASANITVHSSWNEDFNDLVSLHFAIYLTRKDGVERAAELEALNAELTEAWAAYTDHLEHANAAEKRRFNFLPRVHSKTLRTG